jgi:hypothetical protein
MTLLPRTRRESLRADRRRRLVWRCHAGPQNYRSRGTQDPPQCEVIKYEFRNRGTPGGFSAQRSRWLARRAGRARAAGKILRVWRSGRRCCSTLQPARWRWSSSGCPRRHRRQTIRRSRSCSSRRHLRPPRPLNPPHRSRHPNPGRHLRPPPTPRHHRIRRRRRWNRRLRGRSRRRFRGLSRNRRSRRKLCRPLCVSRSRARSRLPQPGPGNRRLRQRPNPQPHPALRNRPRRRRAARIGSVPWLPGWRLIKCIRNWRGGGGWKAAWGCGSPPTGRAAC